jgi:hypothetical protein
VDEHADQDVQVVGLVRRDDALGDAILHLSIERAIKGTPTAAEVTQQYKTAQHPFAANVA